MSASLCWIAWKSPMRRPNARRSSAYARATSYAACAMPTACAPMPIRPPSSVDIAMRKPRFSSPSSRSSGTSASIARSDVDDEFSPSFSSSRVTSTCAASSTNADTPRDPSRSWSVRANSRNVPANAPLVIHCFVPEMCQPPAVALGLRDERAGVRARARLGQRERADRLAARERRHEARALLVGAEREQRQRAGGRVHRDRDADARVRARQLLEREDVREEVGPRPAVLLRHAHAQQPELGQLREQLAREAVRPVPLRRVRRDLGGRELARQRLDLALIRRELEVHARSLVGTGGVERPVDRRASARSSGRACGRSRRSGSSSGRSCGRRAARPRAPGRA